jgi:ankyrin repeat protein
MHRELPDAMLLCIAENPGYARDILSSAQATKETCGWLLLHAVSYESITVVDGLLASDQIDVNFQNERGQCALWWAAYCGYTDIVERLLQRDDVEVDNPDREDCLTPLGVAVLQGHERIVQHLLNTRRVDVNARNRERRTPIFNAVERGRKRIMELLLGEKDLDLSCQDVNGFSPLIYSTFTAPTALTKTLLSHPRSYVNVRDNEGRTALWYAVELKNRDSVRLLLKNGADPEAQDIEGVSPLRKSIEKGGLSTLQMLLSYSRQGHSTLLHDANHGVGGEQSLLCLAAYRGKDRMVQHLLDHGWDVNEVDPARRTPLHLAVEEGHRRVVEVLLSHPEIKSHAQDQCGSTALHEAAELGNLSVANLILAKSSISLNIEDSYGATPLWWATRGRPSRVAKRLLEESNAAVNAVGRFETSRYRDRSTSLHHAVQARVTETVRKLLAVRALNPNVSDHQKWAPLCWAASQGDVEMVELLLTRPDIRVNGVERKEAPPLCLAAREGHIQVVRRLIQRPDIDINQGWGTYMPPLLAAIINGHSSIAMQLLALGKPLDVNAQTCQKESALSLAASREIYRWSTLSFLTAALTLTVSTIEDALLYGGQPTQERRQLWNGCWRTIVS